MEAFEILSKKLNLIQKMKSLAGEQEEVISDGQIESWLELSSRRDQLQHEVSTWDIKLKKVLEKDNEIGAEGRTRFIFKEIAEIIQAIQEIDQRIETSINKQKDGLGSEIRIFRQGKKVARGYGGASPKSPRFIDRQG